jgi:hypothetical protein
MGFGRNEGVLVFFIFSLAVLETELRAVHLSREVLYHLSHAPVLFAFLVSGSKTFYPSWPQTTILLSTSKSLEPQIYATIPAFF